jgi:hypothetical protein
MRDVVTGLTQERIRNSAVVTDAGCWIKAKKRNRGYAVFGVANGQQVRAHRASWLLFRGEITEGLYVCHRCNNKGCFNPEHLYLATHRQNVIDAGRDGLLPGAKTPRGPTAVNATKTVCIHGHPLTEDNVVRYRDGKRACRECRKRLSRESKRRESAAAKPQNPADAIAILSEFANRPNPNSLTVACEILIADYERLRGMEERVKGAPTAVAIYRSSTFLTNDPSNPGELIEKRDAWASLECHELPPEYAGQTVALVPVPGGEGK